MSNMSNEPCPVCSNDVESKIVEHIFPVGNNPSTDVLAMIPAYFCNPCDFGWYGEEAEKILDKAAINALSKLNS